MIDEHIFPDAGQPYIRYCGYQEFAELIMNVDHQVTVGCAVLIVVEKAETSDGIARDKWRPVTGEVLEIHEIHPVVVEEHSCLKGRDDIPPATGAKAMFDTRFDVIKIDIASGEIGKALSVANLNNRRRRFDGIFPTVPHAIL